jgi:hypothetical protein
MPGTKIIMKNSSSHQFLICTPRTLIAIIGACIPRLYTVLTEIVFEAERGLVAFGDLFPLIVNDVECCKNLHRVIMPGKKAVGKMMNEFCSGD